MLTRSKGKLFVMLFVFVSCPPTGTGKKTWQRDVDANSLNRREVGCNRWNLRILHDTHNLTFDFV